MGFWQTSWAHRARVPPCAAVKKGFAMRVAVRVPGRRSAALLTALVLSVGALAGCGQDEPSDGPSGAGGDPGTIQITFDGDSVTPNGERVEVSRGEPVTLEVTADQPGEIHVHSTPEQEFEYDAGTTTLELTIDEPGVVDVESHDLGDVIVQLEVS